MGKININGISGGNIPYTLKIFQVGNSTPIFTDNIFGTPYSNSFTHIPGQSYYAKIEKLGCDAYQSINTALDCTAVDIAYVDMIFALGESGGTNTAKCCATTTNCTPTNILNQMQMYIKDVNSFSSTFNETTLTNRFVPNAATFEDAHVLGYLCQSCGSTTSNAFLRNGFNLRKIYDTYPSENIFNYDVYVRQDPAVNNAAYLGLNFSINKFNSCGFIQSTPNNCADLARSGSCIGLPANLDTLDTITESTRLTYTKTGTIRITKSANTIQYLA